MAGGDAPKLRFLSLRGAAPGEEDLALLDHDERRRASLLRDPADWAAYVRAHAFLRRVVGQHLETAPEEVAFVREPCPCCGAPCGRPAVGEPAKDLHFSLSRSGGWALVAIAADPVGADIEALPDHDTLADVSRVLHGDERAEITSAPTHERPEVFARIWTRKEAYLKAIGVGLAHDVATDYLASAESRARPKGWRVENVPAPRGYAAATAVVSRPRSHSGSVNSSKPTWSWKASGPSMSFAIGSISSRMCATNARSRT